MKKIIEKYSNKLKSPWIKGSSSSSRVLSAHKRLEHKPPIYDLIQEPQVSLKLFERLRGDVRELNERGRAYPAKSGPVRIEWGDLPDRRKYFFIQPWSQKGFLFEQEHKGWIVAKADKLTHERSFIRDSQAWDVVTLFEARGQDLVRLSSSRYGDDPMSYVIYQELLFEELEHIFEVGYS